MSKYLRFFGLVLTLITIMAASNTVLATTDLATTFTYQGVLTSSGTGYNGTCDFQFSLFDDPTLSAPINQIGTMQPANAVNVTSGVFNVQLSFGAAAFEGSDRYLAIAVRCPAGGAGAFTPLLPRQPITPAPYAMFAGNAALATTANGLTALTIQTNPTSPNLIGGFSGNSVAALKVGATIGGGGASGFINQVNGDFGVVGGGADNTAAGNGAFVGGGQLNGANSLYSAVVGGNQNTANEQFSIAGGGFQNLAGGQYSFVGGGRGNRATGTFATVAGGGPSDIDVNPGTTNNRATDDYATVGGGGNNQAGNNDGNLTNAQYGTVAGGQSNTASGLAAAIPGGANNTASGSYSFAAGNNAQAVFNGSFVWADSTGASLSSTGVNQFIARASGGFTFYTDQTIPQGATLPPGGGGWSTLSDRASKSNFESVDSLTVLEDVVSMPISTWNYNAQDASIRHIGPMAQDFYATFGLGEDNKHISTIDADGVALAAIQGLYQVVQDKDAQIASLQTENAELKTRLDDLDQRLSALEALAAPAQAGVSIPVMLAGVLLVGGMGFAGRRFVRKGGL